MHRTLLKLTVNIANGPNLFGGKMPVGFPVLLEQIKHGLGSLDLFKPRVGVIDHRLWLSYGHFDPIFFGGIASTSLLRSVLVATTLHEVFVQLLTSRQWTVLGPFRRVDGERTIDAVIGGVALRRGNGGEGENEEGGGYAEHGCGAFGGCEKMPLVA